MPRNTYKNVQPLVKPKKEKPPKKPNGRPRIELDVEKIRELSANGSTQEEIAAEMQCSVDTLQRNYRQYLQDGFLCGNISIRKAQFRKAMNGDTGMLIWLGKTRLGQKEPESTKDNSLVIEFFKHIDEMAKCSNSAQNNSEVITKQHQEQISGSGLFDQENHLHAT